MKPFSPARWTCRMTTPSFFFHAAYSSQKRLYSYGRSAVWPAAPSRYSTQSVCSVTPARESSRCTHAKSIDTRAGGSLRPTSRNSRASTSASLRPRASSHVSPTFRARAR